MIRTLSLSLVLAGFLHAATFEEIQEKPASRPKNFLIWELMRQDINGSQAQELFYQVEDINERFLFDYASKTDESEIKCVAICLCEPACNLPLIEEKDCLILALTPGKATALTPENREAIAAKLGNAYGNLEWLRTMNQESFYLSSANLENENTLFRLSGAAFRHQHFNHPLTFEILYALSQTKSFESVVYLTVTDPEMGLLQSALSDFVGGKYSSRTHFYLAMNAIKYGKLGIALDHLKESKQQYNSIMDRDKILFWIYQITKDREYLNQLSKSLDINMYVLYARELLELPTQNYFTSLPTSDRPDSIKGIDPFEWREFSQEILRASPETVAGLINRCDGNESVAIQGYVIEKMFEPYVHNFTMAYDRYMTSLSNDKKALLYALMRQETRFIPGLISRSFALGLMQIMPFNVDTISKVHPLKPSQYFDMLKPEINIAYAISHLKHLEDKYYNPILIAYGYNAGFGSTKRLLLNDRRFLPGEYEPFLSMELMGNDENREYGKRVLANYVIYKKILGEEVKITSLFDNLIQPDRSDYFRAEALKSLPQTN